jgi:hypothetical protein
VTLRIQGEVADSPLFQEEFSRFEYLEIDSTVVTDANGDPGDPYLDFRTTGGNLPGGILLLHRCGGH